MDPEQGTHPMIQRATANLPAPREERPHDRRRVTSYRKAAAARRCVWAVAIAMGAGLRDGRAALEVRDDPAGDRARLIGGVRQITAPGAPGSLAVFAANASPVVVGKSDGEGRVAVIASARLGRGRIVAFAHDGYFGAEPLRAADTGRLLGNAMRWAADKPRPRVGLIDGHDLKPLIEGQGGTAERTTPGGDLREFDVLVLTPFHLTREQAGRVRSFVESGGGVLAAATGWGWQQVSKKPMSEFPGNWLVAGSGLAWTDGFAGTTAPGGYAVGGEISPYVNAATALERIPAAGRRASASDLACALESIRLTLRTVPDSEPRFRAEVARMMKALRRLDLVPTRQRPVKADEPLRRFAVGLETAIALDAPVAEVRALAAASQFPGGVPARAPRGRHIVTIDTEVPGWHSLGLYAPPGAAISVDVPATATGLGLAVQIGSHTDELWHLDSWERIPQVVRRFPIAAEHTAAASALGGLIYVDVPERAPSRRIAVTIDGAVGAPYYRLGETTAAEWRSRNRRRPAPWAELAGRNVIFTVPSALARELDDPGPVLTLWDRIVAAQDAFVSLPRRERPERIVADLQISAGYMHSGYPIMIPIDDSIRAGLDERRLRSEGSWGLFHELGHNHQDGAWTFDGTGEVTNNVMVLYVFDRVLGLRYDCGHEAIRDRDARARRIRDFVAAGAPFREWKEDPFLALMMYMQLYEGFGWKPFEAVLAEYRHLSDRERPKSDDEKRDQWLVRFSKAVGRNLGPFFRAWGVPTSDRAQAAIADLPGWMPAGD